MSLTQPGCNDRKLLDTDPLFGAADGPRLPDPADPARARAGRHALLPVQEPASSVRKGEKIDLQADYDARYPRARVMSIMHVYIAYGPQGDAEGRRVRGAAA